MKIREEEEESEEPKEEEEEEEVEEVEEAKRLNHTKASIFVGLRKRIKLQKVLGKF